NPLVRHEVAEVKGLHSPGGEESRRPSKHHRPVAIRPGRRAPSRGLQQAVTAHRKEGGTPDLAARQSWSGVAPPCRLGRSVVTKKGPAGAVRVLTGGWGRSGERLA